MPAMGGRLGQALTRLGGIRLGMGPAAAGAGASGAVGSTGPYLAHLYDNRGRFKRMLTPMLSRPTLKQRINGGYQPVTLDLPLPVRPYADVVGGDGPSSYYRAGELAGSLLDLMMTPASGLAPTTFDKRAGMSFGNAGALANDVTTSLKNASAVPTTGFLFSPNTFWHVGVIANWSIEFFFYQRAVANINNPMFRHQGYADGSGNPGDVLMIYIDAAGQLQFFVHPPNSGIAFTSATGYVPSLNAWHLLELTHAAGTYVLYVDGVARFTVVGTYQASIGQGFEICAHPGSMQDFAIYGTTLSAAQVTARQAARAGGGYQAGVIADAPLGYWRLGDALGAPLARPVVSDMPLILASPLYGQPALVNDDSAVVIGSVGNGGGTGGLSYFSSTTARPITGTKFAIEAWIQPGALFRDRIPQGGESYIGGRTIAKVGDVPTLSGFSLTQNGPDLIYGAPAAGIGVANCLTPGRHHVMWVHDSALGTPSTIYLDGLKIATGNPAGIAAPAAGVTIGNDAWVPAAYHAGFGGTIDEVTFYNYAPTAAQVLAHFNAGTDLTQGDLVKLTEQKGDGTVVYTGIVEDLPDFIDLAPTFQVGLQPLVVELADTYFSKNYSVPTDLIQMARDAVGQTSHLSFSPASMPLLGILGQIDFTNVTCLVVFETVKQFLGPNYWWFVDQDGLVWFQFADTISAPKWSVKRTDQSARRKRSPIALLKNKVLCIGGIPPNKAVPITSLYDNQASQAQYGVRYFTPAMVYPNVVDQPTLDLAAASLGSMLDRRLTTVEIDLPASAKILLGQQGGASMRYWEPNKNPALEAAYGAGRYSPTYIVVDVERDGPSQKVLLGELPITPNDYQYIAERIQREQLMAAVLRPGLSGTIPGLMSGGFFSGAVGTLPTLPPLFTGWALDAQDGLSLYQNGVLVARYGPSGGAGVLQAYSGFQPVDATHRCILRYELQASVVQSLTASYLSFSLKAFRASIQGTSGASSASTSGSFVAHAHGITVGNTGFPAGNAAGITAAGIIQTNPGSTAINASTDPAGNHDHPIPHTHAVNAPDGLYDTGMAQGVHVFIDGTDRTTALGGPWGVGSALDVSDLDISAWITATGWHEIQLSSTSLGVIIAQVTTKAQVRTT